MVKPPNPFNPNQPIDPDYFQGRLDEIRRVIAALVQTRNGKTQHILISGERGIGKTSLAIYTRHTAISPNAVLKTDFKFACAYYTVERGQNIADVCQGLTSKLLESVDQSIAKKCFEKMKLLKLHFGVHVPGVGEISVEPGTEKETKARLYGDFEKAVKQAWESIKETHNGILLILDEIHNLDSFEGVGSFFKVVSEAWAVDGYRNAMFAVVGLPQLATEISKDDPSAPRIFTYVELARMTEDESLAVIHRCLSETEKTIDDAAANWLVKLSGGYPFTLSFFISLDTTHLMQTLTTKSATRTRRLAFIGASLSSKGWSSESYTNQSKASKSKKSSIPCLKTTASHRVPQL
jgi:hypothetical protein